ncbi:MAG: ABC transporter ATP-binding protein [Sphaerochaeta sp.]|jgi:putative ABC transport system ATP-binding protein|nr:ABC transporter ATP-binding protein [Sphaerochaeta sp.]MCI2096670.1 ABC transporter ATP-binding protein [Sphaerochaeta sp.]MCI2103666.1 ABC transporter ATP-binding protein [Sphaerochaeta sp.]
MIRTIHVKKVYHTLSEDVVALDDVNLSINDGELVALSGASGSGKTTLLNVIGTLDSLTGGDVEINGRSLRQMSEKEKTSFRRLHLGFVFQSYNLIPVLSAWENVLLAFQPLFQKELAQTGITNIKEAGMAALRDVGLAAYADRRPGELSGGQQQRVSIARALVRRPSLILADKPTANLDSKNSLTILEILSQMNQRDTVTVLYSSHDDVVLNHVRRVIVLKDGQVQQDGSC